MVINKSVCPGPKLGCRVNVKKKKNTANVSRPGGGGGSKGDQVSEAEPEQERQCL